MSRTATPSVTLTIDGELVSARQGETLLRVIREHGGQVPTLCEFDGLSQRGCLSPVPGRDGWPRPTGRGLRHGRRGGAGGPDDLGAHRALPKMTLELLLAERNHICSVCVMNGQCELQDLAARSSASTMSASTTRGQPTCGSMPPTRCSCWTRTGASCARAACASATSSRACTPGTCPVAGVGRASSPTWPRRGVTRSVARRAASACRSCPDRGPVPARA